MNNNVGIILVRIFLFCGDIVFFKFVVSYRKVIIIGRKKNNMLFMIKMVIFFVISLFLLILVFWFVFFIEMKVLIYKGIVVRYIIMFYNDNVIFILYECGMFLIGWMGM